jgi:hypothetical protein
MGTMTDTYTTPEGFELHRPLLFPDVRAFSDLFTFERFWDFATMNHKSGYPQAETPATITREGWEREVSRFCSVRNLPNGYHMQVTPTDMVLDRIYADESEYLDFAFFDRVEFELIYHGSNNRVLVVADASQIIASRYLAYIDPATVPTTD